MKKLEINKLAKKIVYLMRNEKDIWQAVSLLKLPAADVRSIGEEAVKILATNLDIWTDAASIFEATKVIVEEKGMNASDIGMEVFIEYAMDEAGIPDYADLGSWYDEDLSPRYQAKQNAYDTFWGEVSRLLDLQE